MNALFHSLISTQVGFRYIAFAPPNCPAPVPAIAGIGNGIRGIRANFIVFEQVVNIVHLNAPKSKIIFNNLPTDTDKAVKRWL